VVEEREVRAWFCGEILPLEAALSRFLRRNWRNPSEVPDLRQEIYVRLLAGARKGLPLQAKAYLFTTARNHLIDAAKRARIISFELVVDLGALPEAMETITPERNVSAREELRRLQEGLDNLPPRCREAVVLRRIEGLSQRETAQRMGVKEDIIERHTLQGMRALIDFMLGGSGKIARRKRASSREEAVQS
jgi:RNA polymerase sigma factor (sigma-70 family)